MELRLLGPVELWVDGRLVAMRRPQQALVLAALAAEAPRLLPVETMVERVWGADPPERARRTAQTHIARLRRLLDGEPATARIVRRTGGYLLQVDPEVVDVHRFRRALGEARAVGDDGRRAGLLRAALGLWRGTPLAGLPGGWADRAREVLVRLRLDAVVDWADTEMRLGRPAAVLPDLRDLAVHHPLAEHLVAALMRALRTTGRTAEALQLYAATRQRLFDELGVDPSAELRQAHLLALRPVQPARPAPADRPTQRAAAGVPVR